MATRPAQSTDLLQDSLKVGGSPGTNTPVGEKKTATSSKPPTTQPSSQPKWKHDSSDPLLAYSSPSTTSNASDFTSSAEKEAAARKAEVEAYQKAQEPESKKPRVSKTQKKLVPTENHLKLRKLMDTYGEWEESLKDEFRKSEICLLIAIIMKYANQDAFPDFDSDPDENPVHMRAARPGWELFREYKKFADKHPECSNQTKHTGEWEMQAWWS